MNAPIDRLLATAPFLGVATVCELDPEIRVALPSGEAVTANLALGQHYDAAIGDQLLVIGNEDGHWIIGIVHGKGRFILQHAGDIEIRAGGKLSLVAKKGMSLAAPSLETVVDTFELVAASEGTQGFEFVRFFNQTGDTLNFFYQVVQEGDVSSASYTLYTQGF